MNWSGGYIARGVYEKLVVLHTALRKLKEMEKKE
jgi:hypothetical protein